jgi:sensor histidine kinase regulating citrate/malate metabolism
MKVVVTSSLLELSPSDLELTSVLTNLLDNAVEACESVETGKYVTVWLGNMQGYYIIKVENSCNPSLTVIPSVLDSSETTKTDKELHGFGHRAVCEICKLYNGSFTMYLNGNSVVAVATFAERDRSDADSDCIIV